MRFTILNSLFIFLIISSTRISAQVAISPNDANIHIHGAINAKMVDGKLIVHRHTDNIYASTTPVLRFNPEKAKSGTGISIRFKTSSPTLKINMQISSDDLTINNPSGGFIGIYQSENEITSPDKSTPPLEITPNQEYGIQYEKGKVFSIDIASENIGSLVEYKIVLPIWIDVNLLGIELENGYDLVDYTEQSKPIYVAYGNSITHGRKQNGSNETYAYLLSEWEKWELFNIAVGGGKTSTKMAEMIRDEFSKIDFMTVLIGYNDYAGGSESTATYTENYTNFIETVRQGHPNTPIYCISLTTTTYNTDEESGVTSEEYRQVVRDIVNQMQNDGDSNIYLIEGSELNTVDDLGDQVHLSIDGAINVAANLYEKINLTLSSSEEKLNQGIRIFPNPVENEIRVDTDIKVDSYFVTDISGRRIIKKTIFNNSIHLSELKAGTYLLYLVTDTKTNTIKFSKK